MSNNTQTSEQTLAAAQAVAREQYQSLLNQVRQSERLLANLMVI